MSNHTPLEIAAAEYADYVAHVDEAEAAFHAVPTSRSWLELRRVQKLADSALIDLALSAIDYAETTRKAGQP